MKIVISEKNLEKIYQIKKITHLEFDEILERSLSEYLNKVESERAVEEDVVFVYISASNKASDEAVKYIMNYLSDYPNVIARKYEKGQKWDSYIIKNSDIIIIVPEEFHYELAIGVGVYSERKIAIEHKRKVLLFDPAKKLLYDKFEIAKIEGGTSARKYIVRGNENGMVESFTEIVNEIIKINKIFGRTVYSKEKDDEVKSI